MQLTAAHWVRSSSTKRPAKQSAKQTYLAELLSTDLSRRWDKTFVLAGSLYPKCDISERICILHYIWKKKKEKKSQNCEQCRLKSSLYIEYWFRV